MIYLRMLINIKDVKSIDGGIRMNPTNDKIERVLHIYTKLSNGQVVNKNDLATYFNVTSKSIQRDIEDVREYLERNIDTLGVSSTIEYDRSRKGYFMNVGARSGLTNTEILALSKILIDSRAFTKAEVTELIEKLMANGIDKEDKTFIHKMLSNEMFHYQELQHKKIFKEHLWTIAEAMQKQKCISIYYKKENLDTLTYRKLQPVGLTFSEFYFYLIAFIVKDDQDESCKDIDEMYPIIYRVDRIQELNILEEHFVINYKDRFQEGEFRKRIQFMQGGKLDKIKFDFRGESLDAVLDRLPTAKVIGEKEGVYTITAETYGRGIDMWIRSQGERIENFVRK